MPSERSSDVFRKALEPAPTPGFAWIPVDRGPLPTFARWIAGSTNDAIRHQIENDMVLICYRDGERDNNQVVTVGLFGKAYNRTSMLDDQDRLWDFVEDLDAPGLRSRMLADRKSGREVTHWAPMPDALQNQGDDWQHIGAPVPAGKMPGPMMEDLTILIRHVVTRGGGNVGCTTVGRYWKCGTPVHPVHQWGVLNEFWTHPTLVTAVTHWRPLPLPPPPP